MNHRRFGLLFRVQEHKPGNDLAGIPEKWDDVAGVWGDIRPLGGSEQQDDGMMEAQNRHRIVSRYYSQANPRQRLVNAGRVFEVESVYSHQGRNHWTEWNVREVV